MKKIFTIILISFLIVACRETEEDISLPALLSNPDPDTHAEIQQTISTALNGADVLLADDVFTTYSVVVIERGTQQGIGRSPELGRNLGRPSRFQLIMYGSECVIVDQQSGVHWPLISAECIAE